MLVNQNTDSPRWSYTLSLLSPLSSAIKVATAPTAEQIAFSAASKHPPPDLKQIIIDKAPIVLYNKIGLFNFSTYVGSAMSIYGFAALSRKVGWTGTVVAWTAISLIGSVLCFFMYRPLRKHNLSEENNIQVKTK